MNYYLININNLYYGKENSINGRILIINRYDKNELYYIIQEIGYKTLQGAKKAYNKLKKQYKEENKKIKNISIEKVKILKEV